MRDRRGRADHAQHGARRRLLGEAHRTVRAEELGARPLSARWRKTGVVVDPPLPLEWSASHAAVPTVDVADDRVWLYFTTRDAKSRSHVARARLDVGADPPTAVVEPRQVLTPGPLGAFDDSGAMSSCLVRRGDRQLLYYIGWSLGVTVPFYTFTGCAASDDGGATFTRVSPSPILERNEIDPYLAHSPWVIVDNGVFRMWYSSGTRWEQHREGPRHYYNIRYAESDDGLAWRRTGHVCIDYADASEYALSRPCVLKDDDGYRMWYSRRGPEYRIGYAESRDGLSWERRDPDAGIGPSSSGWDDASVAYGCVFDHGGRRHMLYNGNGYGRTGIGHAVLAAEQPTR